MAVPEWWSKLFKNRDTERLVVVTSPSTPVVDSTGNVRMDFV